MGPYFKINLSPRLIEFQMFERYEIILTPFKLKLFKNKNKFNLNNLHVNRYIIKQFLIAYYIQMH